MSLDCFKENSTGNHPFCFPNRGVHAHRNFDVRALGAGKAPSKGPMGWIWGPLPAMLDFFYLSLNYIWLLLPYIIILLYTMLSNILYHSIYLVYLHLYMLDAGREYQIFTLDLSGFGCFAVPWSSSNWLEKIPSWKSHFDVVRWRKSHNKSHGKSMKSENHKQNIAKSKCIQSIQSFITPKCSMSQWSEGSRQQKRIAQFHDLIHAHMACFRKGGTKGINCKHIRGYPLLKQAISKGIVRYCHLFPEE
jgi:hypothetical protein